MSFCSCRFIGNMEHTFSETIISYGELQVMQVSLSVVFLLIPDHLNDVNLQKDNTSLTTLFAEKMNLLVSDEVRHPLRGCLSRVLLISPMSRLRLQLKMPGS
jgi:hypothetical protein